MEEAMKTQDLQKVDERRKNAIPSDRCCAMRSFIAAALLTCLAAGCGSPIDCSRRAIERCNSSGDNLAGDWEGTWESHDRGYRRTLRAEFTPYGDGEYRGKYEAIFGSVVPLEFESLHSTTDKGGVTRFSGTAGTDSLFPAGCRYDGAADGSTLVINYLSVKDFGVIRLTRSGSASEQSVSQALVYVSGNLLR
jgi:hypothetical protein